MPAAAATKRSRPAPAQHTRTRRSPVDHPRRRRVSGPAAVPRRSPRPASVPLARAVRARAVGLLGSVLHGRAWIALVGILLAGIVFFNVDLLQMNKEIAVTAERSSVLKRENARLKLELARLSSSERIQEAAARRGLALPAPGDVRYVEPGRGDAARAAKRITAPAEDEPLTAAAPADPAVPVPQPVVAPEPVAPAPVAPQPVAPQPVAPQPAAPQPVTAPSTPSSEPAG